MMQRHKQVITLVALAFSICVLTSLAQANNVSQAQVGGLGVAILLIFLMCMKGSEMFANIRPGTRMLREGRQRGEMYGTGKRRNQAMQNKESFFDVLDKQETMPIVQPQLIPPMDPAGTRENQYYREGADIKTAVMLQKLFNFNS